MPLPVADATVHATSEGVFAAEIVVNAWCIDHTPVAGMFLLASAPNPNTGRIEDWSVFSPRTTAENTLEVDTEKSPLGNEVTAFLKNITVRNDTTGQTITNCFAFVDADSARLPDGTSIVNLTLVVKRRQTDVNPVFVWVQPMTGTVTVRREVSCEA